MIPPPPRSTLFPYTTLFRSASGVTGAGSIFAVQNNAEPALATLRYRLKNATLEAAEKEFESAGKKFNRGSFLVEGDRKSTRLNSSHVEISYAVFCLKKKKKK